MTEDLSGPVVQRALTVPNKANTIFQVRRQNLETEIHSFIFTDLLVAGVV